MTVSLTIERATKLQNASTRLSAQNNPSIHEVAHVIGLMVASFPAVMFAPLFYRVLEREKAQALRLYKGDYAARMILSGEAIADLQWWISNNETASKPVLTSQPDIVIQSDASQSGWGACCDNKQAGGPWGQAESQAHINVLETTAAFLALQSFCSTTVNKHVRLELDNTTAVTYVNAMGGNNSSECNAVVRQMWLWCFQKNIFLTAAHIPGVTNVEADRLSRKFHDGTEWALNDEVFDRICTQLVQPKIDLFASRLNKKLDNYVSWQPDPKAVAVDAFSLNWATQSFYAFPPFSLLTKIVQKVQEEAAEGILIVPWWPTQPWYPVVMQMLVDQPRILPHMQRLLYLHHNLDKVHPLHSKLRLLACHLSGNHSKVKAFQNKLPISLLGPGKVEQSSNTKHILTNGPFSVVKGKLIQFVPL